MLTWKQAAGVKPWSAKTAAGEYIVNSYMGKYGPRFVAWFRTGKDIKDVSGMHGDIEYVKARAERHAGEQG